ncbi:hypothetical protein LWI29_035959 [Acer saccharum]|uniref:Uncharacterized protein n=1 Tax=Acer saccharum TaxID=4024 RepID=A0AA39TGU0_ACESA|nr:hypothetical protein LWI29_035959 [Acer saccharum]
MILPATLAEAVDVATKQGIRDLEWWREMREKVSGFGRRDFEGRSSVSLLSPINIIKHIIKIFFINYVEFSNTIRQRRRCTAAAAALATVTAPLPLDEDRRSIFTDRTNNGGDGSGSLDLDHIVVDDHRSSSSPQITQVACVISPEQQR